ncbi:hypothetical protein E1218_05755 [Kribbella turkmenica]|uniref:Uncharacterized protein n=1 Tax=Kribbella turkmenica TaxID=2530375 RepID=A0A4V2YGZ2_9ACTN|nr:hypothetical protein [Kribbella turkmenica]TDD28917.1 hypothetical protein E1218_05755 [Kribbella turkmenica]
MRCLFWGLGWLAACGLVFAGLMIGFVGFADLNVERNVYRLDVARSGDDCGGGFVHLDAGTGAELYCGSVGVRPIQKPKTNAMFGFTAEQKAEVYRLARELGEDGLSAADEDRIQALVEKYKATVPPADRYRTANRRWGVPDAWIGVGMIGAGGLGILVLRQVAD